MKKCSHCNKKKEESCFRKNKNKKDGYSNYCKDCGKYFDKKYARTKQGLIAKIYNHQLTNSKRRKHIPPTYSKKQLMDWCFNHPNFDKLYSNWVKSGYDRWEAPSVDRLCDDDGYSFNNIRLVRYKDNVEKNFQDYRDGNKINKTKCQKPILQYDKQGIFIAEFISASHVEFYMNIPQSNISSVCLGKRKTAGGFIWKFKNDNDVV